MVLALLIGIIAGTALVAAGRRQSTGRSAPPPGPPQPPRTAPVPQPFNVPNPAPTTAPQPAFRVGDRVRAGPTLKGTVLSREWSDDHRQWLYRLDTTNSNLLEQSLTLIGG